MGRPRYPRGAASRFPATRGKRSAQRTEPPRDVLRQKRTGQREADSSSRPSNGLSLHSASSPLSIRIRVSFVLIALVLRVFSYHVIEDYSYGCGETFGRTV